MIPQKKRQVRIAFLAAILTACHCGKSSVQAFTSPAFTALKTKNSPHPHTTRIQVASSPPSTETTTEVAAEAPTPEVGYTIGDTKGAVLLLENVAISRGSNQILENINLRVERGQRWGIVGPNGVGKSTLLGGITGSVRMDPDSIALVAPKVSVGYLRQTAVSGSTKTVYEEACSEMKEIEDAKARMDIYEKLLTDGDTSEETLMNFDKASTDFANAGGWTQAQDVDSVLKGLGFLPEDSDRLCSDFSGGWQMRIALARLLLSNPDVLLLDEPSNHLDSSARDWLGKYLSSFQGSLFLVSHDLSLITSSTNNIAEVSAGTLQTYVSCSYDKYLEEKEFRAKTAMAEYERNKAEADRLQAYVDKWGASATKATSAQSRVKMIEKMKKEGKLTPPPIAIVAKQFKPSLDLPDPPKSIGDVLLGLEGADIGYEQYGDVPLLKNIDLEIQRGMKLILRGPNGAGKSTLMTALRGKLGLMGGSRIENEKLRLGTFTQDLAQELDVEARAVDLVTAHAREGKFGDITISDETARGVMGRLGLTSDKPLRKIGQLSGGEKARVALSMFALKASNVLMLDEPSNHLDVECIEALADALSSWGGKDGAVVVVSHDRSFCDAVGFTHVGTVRDGKLTIEERDLNDSDWQRYELTGSSIGGDESSSTVVEQRELTPEEKEAAKQKRKMAHNAPKRIKKLEKMVEDAEAKVAELDDEMMTVGNDVGKLTDLSAIREKEQEKIEKYMEEWEELEELLSEMN